MGKANKRSLTARQNRFVAEYLVDLNATQAAARAGYKAPNKQGPRLLMHAQIATAVVQRQARIIEKIELRAAHTLEELRRVIQFDPGEVFDENGRMRAVGDLPPEVRSCITSVKVREIWAGEGGDRRLVARVSNVRFANKLAAIAKALELFDRFRQRRPTSADNGRAGG